MSQGDNWFMRVPTGISGCLLVSEGPMCVCGCLLVSEGTYW